MGKWPEHMDVYVDGCSIGNPGPSGVGVVLTTRRGVVKWQGGFPMESESTNNEAEYTAVIRGMQEAKTYGGTHVRVFSDSELVVQQLYGDYSIGSTNLAKLNIAALDLANSFDSCEIIRKADGEVARADKLAHSAAQLQREVRPLVR